jgi:hypothetical protein
MFRKGLTKDQDQFIEESRNKFPNKFDYGQVMYVNNITPITLICAIHGEIEIMPKVHLRSIHGCQQCSKSNKGKKSAITTFSRRREKFLDKANAKYGSKFDYSKANFAKIKSPITIVCPTHGEFNTTPRDHLRSEDGCEGCREDRLSKERLTHFLELAKAVHGHIYDYSWVKYIDNKTPVIICPKHGEFRQRPENHTIMRQGCPKCRQSKGEERILLWLQSHNVQYITQFQIQHSIWDGENPYLHGYDGCPEIIPLKFDFWLPEYDIFIEFDGRQHREPVEQFGGEAGFLDIQRRDAIKNYFCECNKLELLRIPDYYFDLIEDILQKRIFSN